MVAWKNGVPIEEKIARQGIILHPDVLIFCEIYCKLVNYD